MVILSEIKTLVVNKTRGIIIDIGKFNSLNKLYRVTAWIKRYVNNVWKMKRKSKVIIKAVFNFYWITKLWILLD